MTVWEMNAFSNTPGTHIKNSGYLMTCDESESDNPTGVGISPLAT